jgi:hypothetical protein
MKDLSYYMSIVSNPWTQNNETTQEDVSKDSEFRFRFDSIVSTIGTSDCKYNIQLFYDDVIQEMDTEQKRTFFNLCIEKLSNEYHLPMLKDFLLDWNKNLNIGKEVKDCLFFCETEKCVDFLSLILKDENIELVRFGDLEEKLLLLYDNIMHKLPDVKDELPRLIYYNYFLASKKDTVLSLLKLIGKNNSAIVTELITKRGEHHA